MKKWILPIGMLIIMSMFILSFTTNLQIYNSTGDVNFGLSGGLNDFFGGLIMNVLEAITIFIGVFIYSRQIKEKRPKGLTPID